MIAEAIAKLVDGHDLTEEEAGACMDEIMAEQATAAQFGAFVVALRLKGETVDEITGMARAMRDKALRVRVEGPLLDTCGTGGDGKATFDFWVTHAPCPENYAHSEIRVGREGQHISGMRPTRKVRGEFRRQLVRSAAIVIPSFGSTPKKKVSASQTNP